jgi:hypothetical protein
MASKDRTWPFSFENLCDALGLDAGGLRRELQTVPALPLPDVRASVANRRRRASARLKRAAAASARQRVAPPPDDRLDEPLRGLELRAVADAAQTGSGTSS